MLEKIIYHKYINNTFPRFRLHGRISFVRIGLSPKPSYEAPPYDVVGAASRGGKKGKELLCLPLVKREKGRGGKEKTPT